MKLHAPAMWVFVLSLVIAVRGRELFLFDPIREKRKSRLSLARPVIFCANSVMMCAGTPEARTIRHKI
jgi:hypothetical protein